jgi:hypothetical protein
MMKVLGPLNTTFLTLIPKKDNPVSFDGFRPISCVKLHVQDNCYKYSIESVGL